VRMSVLTALQLHRRGAPLGDDLSLLLLRRDAFDGLRLATPEP